MNNSWFFIGFAILIIFGLKALLFVAFFYVMYFLFSKIQDNDNFFSEIEKMLKTRSSVEDLSPIKKTKKKQSNNSSFNLPNMNFKQLPFLALIIVGIMIIIDGFVMVPAGEVAVILDRGRGVLEKSLPTGLHLKIPFWQKATNMDIKLQAYTMSGNQGEGDYYGNDAIEVLTKDGQKVDLDLTVQFYLPPEYASHIYSTVGINYVSKIVRPAIRSVVRNVVTGFESKELFQIETRQKAQEMMISEMNKNLNSKKLLLDNVLLRNIKFSDIYLKAIEEKQIAEQKIQKAEFEKQEAEIRKEKKIIEAEAEAESIKLKGEALKRSPEIIKLEMVNKLSPSIKWGVLPDGVLPMLNMEKLQ